jgi:IclR family pca regulon transcriptional regulator
MPTIKRSELEQRNVDAHGPDYLESLARGLRLIGAFNTARRSMTLSELARSADLPRATARRTLYTLERMGFVETEGKLFGLTPRVLTLATAYLVSNQVSTVLQPAMDRIAERAHEVCSAAILDGDQVTFIARASPARVFTNGLELGYRLPAFCSSVGRVLLGRMSDEELEAYLDCLNVTAVTPHTVTDKSVLKALIVTDRKQGYSLVDQEAEAGFRSIAVPIRRYDGGIVAAMNVGAHVDRISVGQMIDRFLPLLRSAAKEVQPMFV